MGKLQKLLNGRSPGDSNEKSPSIEGENLNSSGLGSRTSLDSSTEGMARIANPSPRDVIFGRGKPFQSHPGNVYLHKIVNMHKDRYFKSRRYDKLAIAEEIVSEIKQGSNGTPGRFLKRVEGEDHWVEVSSEVAREKVSHALRGKPRKLPSAAPGAFCRPAGEAAGKAGTTTAFGMELKALQISLRFEDQSLPSFQAHRSLFPSAASGGGPPLSLMHSLVNGRGGVLPQFPSSSATAAGSLLPSNLDILATRIAAANSTHLQQQRMSIGGGAMNPSSFLSSAATASLTTRGGGAANMNEHILPGVDLALARVRARDEAIARFAHNRLSSSDTSFLRQGQLQHGRFGGSQFPR
jgi:hypothetical protein